jgi:hypothetical protein
MKKKTSTKHTFKSSVRNTDSRKILGEVLLAVFYNHHPRRRDSLINCSKFVCAVEQCFPKPFIEYCLQKISESPPRNFPQSDDKLTKWFDEQTNERQMRDGDLLRDGFEKVIQYIDSLPVRLVGRVPCEVDSAGGRKPGGRFGA